MLYSYGTLVCLGRINNICVQYISISGQVDNNSETTLFFLYFSFKKTLSRRFHLGVHHSPPPVCSIGKQHAQLSRIVAGLASRLGNAL